MNLCIQLLRHSSELDYRDFTSDEKIIAIMRRKEIWEINRDLSGFKQMSRDAFSEFVNLIASVEDRINAKLNVQPTTISAPIEGLEERLRVLEGQ